MQRDRYDRGWMQGRGGYERGYGARRPPGRGRYDGGMRGYDAGWTEEMAYGREPGMRGAPAFTPFGWDPMMRWSGWDPLMGFVPYQDTPREWSYGLAEDARRYDHAYYRASAPRGYGREYHPHGEYGGEYRTAPRRSPLYGRQGERAVRERAERQGYGVESRPGPRR